MMQKAVKRGRGKTRLSLRSKTRLVSWYGRNLHAGVSRMWKVTITHRSVNKRLSVRHLRTVRQCVRVVRHLRGMRLGVGKWQKWRERRWIGKLWNERQMRLIQKLRERRRGRRRRWRTRLQICRRRNSFYAGVGPGRRYLRGGGGGGNDVGIGVRIGVGFRNCRIRHDENSAHPVDAGREKLALRIALVPNAGNQGGSAGIVQVEHGGERRRNRGGGGRGRRGGGRSGGGRGM